MWIIYENQPETEEYVVLLEDSMLTQIHEMRLKLRHVFEDYPELQVITCGFPNVRIIEGVLIDNDELHENGYVWVENGTELPKSVEVPAYLIFNRDVDEPFINAVYQHNDYEINFWFPINLKIMEVEKC